MKFDPFKLIPIMAGAILLGSVGAFFLYVSPLTILCVATLLMAMVLVFALGILPALARLSDDSRWEGQSRLPAIAAPPSPRTSMNPSSSVRRVAPSEFL
jgi:hypothetical protein